MSRLRVGIDVGGTFTKAVAVCPATRELRAHAAVPTTHAHGHGVAQGVADALRSLLKRVDGDSIELVAFSTTQAMNALLEGDVGRVGVVGLGEAPESARRAQAHAGSARSRSRRDRKRSRPSTPSSMRPAASTSDTRRRRARSPSRAGCAGGRRQRRLRRRRSRAPSSSSSERAAAHGLPACAGHELSGAYGLETRTISAAINASILPVVERTTPPSSRRR